MDETKKSGMDELMEAYEEDRERRSVREDELQAAKDYLGVLLKEIEEKNRELDEKKAEAGKLADALKKSENEKAAEAVASAEAKESNRYKSIWIGIAIIEFLAIIAVVVSLFIVYGKLKSDYEEKLAQATSDSADKNPEVTQTVTPAPVTGKYAENLQDVVSALAGKLKDGFSCRIDKIDGLEYLVFSKGDFKICYKNEYYVDEKDFSKVIILEKGDRRIVERMDYSLTENPEKLCPFMCNVSGNELAVITDYRGFGSMPGLFRLIDTATLAEYNGDDINEKIESLVKASFSDKVTGILDTPILFELTTSKAQYKYGLTEVAYNEIGYSNDAGESNRAEKGPADFNSEFQLNFGEDGITWSTVIKLGRKMYLGELKGDIALGFGSVVVTNAKFGAYVQPGVEDPENMGIIIPAESIPERYITIMGYNSERFYIAINDKIPECTYDWERLNTEDSNNWFYTDENGQKASVRGIDVSKYQGVIDWKKVAEAGVEFAIVRLGYRGMNEGTLEMDPYFEANMMGAAEAGIKTGVYFFSQAITKEEAEEEANYVLGVISKYNVTYPVIFDTERVATYDARANKLGYSERTDMCVTFCDRIAEEGYTPMIYANTKYLITGVDLERLTDYDIWYAVYSKDITYPYNFQMLQYSETGSIPGITGNVDLNISFVDYSKADERNE